MTAEGREKTSLFERENYCEELVVQDGNLINARGRGFIRFGKTLGEALNLTFDDKWYKE